MKQSLLKQIMFVGMAAAVAHLPAHGQEEGYYPHGALTNAYYMEKSEQAKADEMEREVVRKRDQYENERRDVERQIAGHKFQVEQLKNRQAAAQEELEKIQADMVHVRGEIEQYQAEHRKVEDDARETLLTLQSQRQELEMNQQKLEKELADLTMARKRSEREIHEKSINLQHMRANITHTETRIAAAEAKRAQLEAEEMKARTDWLQVKSQLSEMQTQQEVATSQLEDARTRWNKAQKDLSDTKADLAKVKKNRDQVVGRAQEEVARYEKEIMAANRAKIAGEAEQVRMSSEIEKMHDYASRIRETRDQAVEQEAEVNGLVLRTKVAVETARTELGRDVDAVDRRGFIEEKEQARRRGLASAAEAASMLGGARVWTTTSRCKAFRQPNSSGPAVGFFDSGKKLMGKEFDSDWTEISNGTGKTVYVESRCGDYRE